MSATRKTIRFFYDDQLVELSDVDPNRTVLQWLREDRNCTGSKEGCAEGDCGACAVVVAEVNENDSLDWRVINSCIQFLPTLDGKQLLTVENLRAADGSLHPVQQAMVDCHGSQCGFCTPGFVMALFELFQSGGEPARDDIDNALAGNLCRCTGYRPIIAAARQMGSASARPDRFASSAAQVARQLAELSEQPSLAIEHGERQYFAPRTVAELNELLDQYPQALILAGGTDVGLWVTKELQQLQRLIYIGDVVELQSIEQSKTHLEIGAAVSLTRAYAPLIRIYPDLRELLLRFAGPPIRNAATLCGNIANASPIGDSMPALIALEAELELQSVSGIRAIALDKFYTGYKKTELKPSEFVARVRIPLPQPDQVFRSYKVSKRFDQDISSVCAAFCLHQVDGLIAEAHVAFGGVAAVPARAPLCEAALIGKPLTQSTIDAAKAGLDQDFSPITDMRASESYRETVSRNLLQRLFNDISGSGAESVYQYGR